MMNENLPTIPEQIEANTQVVKTCFVCGSDKDWRPLSYQIELDRIGYVDYAFEIVCASCGGLYKIQFRKTRGRFGKENKTS